MQTPSSPIWRTVHLSDGGGEMARLFSIRPGITLRGRKFLGIIGRAAHTQVWRTANWHMTVMLTTTGVVIIDLIIRFGQLNGSQSSAFAAILSVIAAALVSFGSTYGGTMVFDYQFNVEPISG